MERKETMVLSNSILLSSILIIAVEYNAAALKVREQIWKAWRGSNKRTPTLLFELRKWFSEKLAQICPSKENMICWLVILFWSCTVECTGVLYSF